MSLLLLMTTSSGMANPLLTIFVNKYVLQVSLLLLMTTSSSMANPPLTIFGNEYVFSTFHYPTDPNAGKAHREEYARKVSS